LLAKQIDLIVGLQSPLELALPRRDLREGASRTLIDE
jgi:hypothetical protein